MFRDRSMSRPSSKARGCPNGSDQDERGTYAYETVGAKDRPGAREPLRIRSLGESDWDGESRPLRGAWKVGRGLRERSRELQEVRGDQRDGESY